MHLNPLAGPSRRTRRAVLAAAIPVALAAAALPSSADAATASVVNTGPNGVLGYVADTGETNNVRISAAPGKIVIDDVVPIRAGAGCSLVNGNAECRVNVDSIDILLRDRNDVVQYVAPHQASILGEDGNDLFFGGIRSGVGVGPIRPAFFFGGPGLSDRITYSAAEASTNVTLDNVRNDGLTRQDDVRDDIEIIEGSNFDDTLTGSNQDKTERLIGRAGLDSMSGLGGNDIFEEGPTTNGADNFFGGAGVDRVSYDERSIGVDVRLDNLRNDGQAGEFDFAGSDVEQLVGSRAGDTLVGNSAANKMFGSLGNDSLFGLANGDFLSGGAGQDFLFGHEGNDVLEAKDREADFHVDCGTDNDIGNHDTFEQRVSGCESGDIG